MPKIRYADMTLTPLKRRIIQQANEIIREYAQAGLDLTLRQLYYCYGDIVVNEEQRTTRVGCWADRRRRVHHHRVSRAVCEARHDQSATRLDPQGLDGPSTNAGSTSRYFQRGHSPQGTDQETQSGVVMARSVNTRLRNHQTATPASGHESRRSRHRVEVHGTSGRDRRLSNCAVFTSTEAAPPLHSDAESEAPVSLLQRPRQATSSP